MRKTLLTLSLALLPTSLAGGSAANPDEIAIRQSYERLAQATLKGDSAAALSMFAPQFRSWTLFLEPGTREEAVQQSESTKLTGVESRVLEMNKRGNAYLVRERLTRKITATTNGKSTSGTQVVESLDTWQKLGGRWQIVERTMLSILVDFAGQKQVVSNPAPLSAAQRQAVQAALRPLLRPISTKADAAAGDLAFLTPLASARVIGAGEGSHGTHEHFVLKARIFKELVTKHGFTTLAFESNMAGGTAVQSYISGESDDLSAALRGLGFAIWRTAEVRDLLVWMRQYNASRGDKPALRFIGLDLQDPIGSAKVLAEWQPSLQTVAAPFVNLEPAELQKLMQDKTEGERLTGQAAALVKAVRALPANTPRLQELQWLARTVQQGVLFQGGQGLRDDFMAENMLAFLAGQPQAKVMLWAHNGHISKAPAPIKLAGGVGDMGLRLSEKLGQNYRTIGQTFSGGTILALNPEHANKGMQPLAVAAAHPDSPEALASAPSVLLLSDVQKVPALKAYFAVPRPTRVVGQSSTPGRMGYSLEELPRAYDVLIFSGKSTPTTPAR